METSAKLPRDPRVQSYPEKFQNYAQYLVCRNGASAKFVAATFADISLSGMRLISRFSTDVTVGDFVRVGFTLPGREDRIERQACVVRKTGDFEFAVRFVHFAATERNELHTAVSEYVSHVHLHPWFELKQNLAHWYQNHKQGLWIALAGFLVIGGATAVILFNSDEFQGRKMKPWGPIYPKEWSTNYYKPDSE